MPHVTVKMYAGRSEADKARLAEALAQAVKATMGSSDASISIEDVPAADWAEHVYRPEILDKPQLLYRRPGYDPFG